MCEPSKGLFPYAMPWGSRSFRSKRLPFWGLRSSGRTGCRDAGRGVPQVKHYPAGNAVLWRGGCVSVKTHAGQKKERVEMTRKEIKVRAGKTARRIKDAVEKGDDNRTSILLDRLGRLCSRLACAGVVTASLWFDHFTRSNGLGVM